MTRYTIYYKNSKQYTRENVNEKDYVAIDFYDGSLMYDFTLDEIIEYKDRIDEEILEKKKKEIEERIYLLKLKYDRLIYMQEEIKNKKSYTRVNETEQEKVLRRKYEKRNVGKSA